MFSYIHWNIDPSLINWGGLEIRYYGVLFATGFLLGYFLIQKIFKKENIPEKELDLLTTVVVIGTIIGARLGHVLFYAPEYYFQNPQEILMIWHGGLASHGGALGILLALIYYTKRSQKKSYLWILDRLVIATALAGGFIRIGNLMNSEIVGIQTSAPWAFIFERLDSIPRHPAQLYEAIGYFIIAAILYFIYKKHEAQTPRGRIFSWFFILVFSFRFMIEFLKVDQIREETITALNMGQLLSIPFVIAGILLLIYSYSSKAQVSHNPGKS